MMLEKQEKINILKDIFGDYRMENKDQYLFKCPKCDHHKHKLSINLQKGFKCWICLFSGHDVGYLIQRYGSAKHKEMWWSLSASKPYDDIFNLFPNREECKLNLDLKLPKEFKTLVREKKNYSNWKVFSYLKERKITQEDINRWRIGYCLEGDYANRIIVPSVDDRGLLNYFVARSFDGNYIKYLNVDFSKDIVFNHLFIDWSKDVYLVEGVFDAIRIGNNAIPLLGSTLGDKLRNELIKYKPRVYVALDSDARKKATKVATILKHHGIPEVYFVDVSVYGVNDIGEMTNKQFLEAKKNATLLDETGLLYITLGGL